MFLFPILFQYSVLTDLVSLYQKHLVEKKTNAIMGVRWEVIKLVGMLPGLPMNPGIPFKESRSSLYNDMVFYTWALIMSEIILLCTLNEKE